MNAENQLVLRPHHGLCIRYFRGKGYSPDFVRNMEKVVAVLRQNPAQQFALFSGIDSLCICCPHHQQGCCDSEEKVQGYDRACLELCGLQNGQTLTWGDFQTAVATAVSTHGLETICRGCQWLSICLDIEKTRQANA